MWMMQLQAPIVSLAITTGEPAGVGLEVSVVAAQRFLAEQSGVAITLIGDPSLLRAVDKN